MKPRFTAAFSSSRGVLRPLAVGLCAALAVSACSQVTGEDGSGEGENGDVTLRLVSGTGPEQDAMTKLIAEYESEHPEVTIKSSYAAVDQLQSSLRTQLGAGNAPDIFITFPGGGSSLSIRELDSAGLLADLSDEDWIGRIPEGFSSTTGVEGRTLMLPLSQGVIGNIFNREVLSQAGVRPPSTWSEVLDACERLSSQGVVPFALGVSDQWMGQLIPYAITASTVYARDPDFAQKLNAGEATFSDSGWRDAMEKYLAMENEGCFNENTTGTSADEALRMVAKGDAAMTVMVHAVLPTLEQYNPRATYGMAAFPGVDDSEQVWIPAAAGTGYSVSKSSPNIEAAKEFLAFLAEPEHNAEYAEVTDFVPLLSGVDADTPAALEPMLKYVRSGRSTPYMDQNWPNAEVQPAHLAGVQELLAGTASVEDVLAGMDRALEGS
jgi:raffinose/stachyose/melibiose transport system substrate-binding protein